MRYKYKECTIMNLIKICLGLTALLTFVFSHSNVWAQQSINATGGDALGGGGTVSYSMGQVFCQTHEAVNGSVAEGVQQAYEISVVAGINEAESISLSVSAFPNPTDGNLTLSIEEFEISDLYYFLYDMQGKLLQNEKIISNRTSISIDNFVTATYFIRVVLGNNEVKTFKIIKN